MICDQTEKISLLIDGELEETERRVVEKHLLECPECNRAREDFLNLRSKMIAYSDQLDRHTVEQALSRIISQPVSTSSSVAAVGDRRNPFTNWFNLVSFNSRLAAAAALLAVTFTIGGIAFLRINQKSELVSDNQPAQENRDESRVGGNQPSTTSGTINTPTTKRKNGKGGTNRERRPRQPDNRGLQPRERNTPAIPPRQQASPPPTYALVDENLVSPGATMNHVDGEMLTARHLEQSEVLLRAFRNIRVDQAGSAPEIGYERRRARQLLYRNIRLRREADNAGDVQVESLLGSLEPILLDIANLRDKPDPEEVRAIRDRVERKNLVPLLQVNSTTVARAYE